MIYGYTFKGLLQGNSKYDLCYLHSGPFVDKKGPKFNLLDGVPKGKFKGREVLMMCIVIIAQYADCTPCGFGSRQKVRSVVHPRAAILHFDGSG